MNRNESTPFSVRIIHASAGTGKTHRLTREFIKMLTPEKFINRVKRTVAITFTEKTACEMKERIIHSIFDEILKDIKDEKTCIEYENQLFLLRISTIHSFCKSLLKRFSFLFNIDPNFSICEPEEGFLYFNQALAKFLEKTSSDDEKIKPLQAMKLGVFLDNIRELEKTHPQIF
ncbi:MAG TPA: UvrD-helicase domain-containing protein, partial [bacterium]|nr:UvrD-helicase domain-containing protein [bacterium]